MKILIIDDHALFREGLRHVLDALEANVSIIEAADCDRAFLLAAENPDLDLVLLDLNMPGKDGFTVLQIFTKKYPATPVVILSASTAQSDVQRALDSGAMGYIPKDTTSAVMLNALRLILSGEIYVPYNMTQPDYEIQNTANGATRLTPRQAQVLALLVRGFSNKKIASQLDLAESTVKMHVTSIMKGLGVDNRTQAAMAVEKQGIKLPPV